MKKKTILAVSLTAAMALSALSPAASAAQAPASVLQTPTSTMQEFQIDPRFDHMSRISSSLTINALGRANCTGAFTTYDEYDSTLTVTLQQFSKDGHWTDFKEWSMDFTGSGVHAMEKGYYVPFGHRYRVVTVVQIFDTNGKVLETESCDSPVKEF